MTMPPWSDDPEESRPYFRRLKELAARHELPSPSMGMSHDLEVAIEEGATHLRIGTALFGPPPQRMTAGFFSPMPPARTGVADYSAALFEELRKLGMVKLDDTGADVRLYHLGNNQLHREIYREALAASRRHRSARRGAAALLPRIADRTRVYRGIRVQLRALERRAGRTARGATARARPSDPLYFRYPMLRRVVERSLAVIVHNPAAARVVRRARAGGARLRNPAPVRRPSEPAGYDVIRLRAQLGADSLGLPLRRVRTPARVEAPAHRARRLQPVAPRGRTGDASGGGRLRFLRSRPRARRRCFAHEGIRRIGYAPESAFWMYAHAVDACINLRYPSAGKPRASPFG